MEMSAKQRNILIAASILMLVLALVLWRGFEGKHPYEPLADMLRDRGYTVDAEQLYSVGNFEDQSISEVLSGVDLDEAVTASQEGGFPSRVDRAGDISLILCALGNQDVITIFLLDGEAELCFVQPLLGGRLKAVGEEAGNS